MTFFGLELDWKSVAVIIGGIGSTIGLAFTHYVAYRRGRIAVLKEDAERNVKVKDDQLKVAANRPDKRTLVDGLRNGKF